MVDVRANRQDAKISSPAALSGLRFINTTDRQTVHRTRQTSREITRGAWPHDLLAKKSYRYPCVNFTIRVSALLATILLRECASASVNCASSCPVCFYESPCVEKLSRGSARGSTRSVNLHERPHAVRVRLSVNREQRIALT